MKTEKNYKNLIKQFPNVFGDLSYIDCGIGWYDLLSSLAGELDILIKNWIAANEDKFCIDCNQTQEEHPYTFYFDNGKTITCEVFNLMLPQAVQVKEKFGGLRFYTRFYIKGMEKIISKYEKLSFTTCENCGNTGEICGKSWYTVLCTECNERKEKNGKFN